MPDIRATQPPMVRDFSSLEECQKMLLQQQPVLASADLEMACVPGKGINPLDKLAEAGITYIDTKQRPPKKGPNGGGASNSRLESFAKLLHAEHIITEEFCHQTEQTCDAGHHRRANIDPGCAHHPRPYHCRFTDSTFLTQAETIERLAQIFKELSTLNLSDEEKAAGKTRNIKLLVWDSHCEESVFFHGGLDLLAICPTIELWDLQMWYHSGKIPRATSLERGFKACTFTSLVDLTSLVAQRRNLIGSSRHRL